MTRLKEQAARVSKRPRPKTKPMSNRERALLFAKNIPKPRPRRLPASVPSAGPSGGRGQNSAKRNFKRRSAELASHKLPVVQRNPEVDKLLKRHEEQQKAIQNMRVEAGM